MRLISFLICCFLFPRIVYSQDTIRTTVELTNQPDKNFVFIYSTPVDIEAGRWIDCNKVISSDSIAKYKCYILDTINTPVLIDVHCKYVHFKNVVFTSIVNIHTSGQKIFFENCYFNQNVSFNGYGKDKECSIKLKNCSFSTVGFMSIKLDTITIDNCQFQSATFRRDTANMIILSNNYWRSKTPFDLINKNPDERAIVFLQNPEPELMLFDFSRTKLHFADSISKNDIVQIFNQYLDLTHKSGDVYRYQQLDIDYQNFLYNYGYNPFLKLFGLVKWCWNGYGYYRHRIIYWLLGALLILSFTNLKLAYLLNAKVYEIENISKLIRANRRKYRRSFRLQLYISAVYTSLIFLSLYVKIDKVKFANKKLLIYFFFIYLFGILCLAYFANYILKS